MLFDFKKYFAIVTLLVFLFPIAIESAHAIQHSKDVHCFSSGHHIHQQEHHCSICDYSSPIFNSSITQIFTLKATEQIIHYPFFYQTIALFAFLKGTSLRAPPAVEFN